jgi:hypothetical protein
MLTLIKKCVKVHLSVVGTPKPTVRHIEEGHAGILRSRLP